MSQDLFAAFGDAMPAAQTSQEAPGQTLEKWGLSTRDSHADASLPEAADEHPWQESQLEGNFGSEEDDFGDFEDASATTPTDSGANTRPKAQEKAAVSSQTANPSAPFPPKAQKRESTQPPDSKIGKHPFAGHMDFLFEAGEDEYDAGMDELDNLASNPEAAMAYSKRIIAEQEARLSRSTARLAPSGRDAQQTTRNAASLLSSSGRASHKMTSSSPTALSKSQSLSESQRQPQPQAQSKPASARNRLRKKSGYMPAKDPNVLFDADDLSEDDQAEDDDDEFGDFEESATTLAPKDAHWPKITASTSPSSVPGVDLIGLFNPPQHLRSSGEPDPASAKTADKDCGQSKSNYPQPTSRQDLFADDNPWADFEPTMPKQVSTPTAVDVEDDAWDDFEAMEPLKTVPIPSPQGAVSPPVASGSSTQPKAQSQFRSELLPPTNIPPPALLLSIFPSLFSAAHDALFGALGKLDSAQRQQLLSHPATQQFLFKYLNQGVVLAHIIAGRKQRWKRDQIFAQSMRIGPSAAGGKGGMKLTGIDKSEVAKEEREVLDTVKLWKAQAGKLRGAVTGASSQLPAGRKMPSVPDISAQMPVRTLKALEGGFKAPHACALCGLRREERVAKVDEAVDDSFGEFWVQNMDMHVTCREFWEEHKGKLRQRQ